MTDDTGIGIFLAKVLQQFIHRLLLGLSAGVGRMAFGIETALVADTDRTAVVFPGMCPSDILGQESHHPYGYSSDRMVARSGRCQLLSVIQG